MKIVKVECDYIRMPLDYVQIHEHIPTQRDAGCVLTRITCDNGLVGFGRTYGGTVFGSKSVQTCVLTDLAPVLLDQDPSLLGSLSYKMEVTSHFLGRTGVVYAAVSTVDIALWDLLGKFLGVPLYKLLGQVREEVPVYSSEGWVYLSTEQLVEAVLRRKNEGYNSYKLRLPLERKGCIEKMKAVREAVGPEFNIMVDVQNAWQNIPHALRNAQAIKEYDPFWIEEPVMVQDLDGHAAVWKTAGVPVAGGEHIYSKTTMREAFSKQAFNYAQPDVMRIGGITELQKVIGMAESWFVPVVPHGACDIHTHVALAHPSETVPYVELLTDSELPLLMNVLYTDYVPPKNGKAYVTSKPGLGYTLNEEAIREFTVND